MDTPSAAPPEAPFRFPVTLTIDDMIAFNRFICKFQPNRFLLFMVIVFSSFFISAVLGVMKVESLKSIYSVYLYLGGFVLAYLSFSKLFQKPAYQNLYPQTGYTMADKVMSFYPEGLTIERDGIFSSIRWDQVIAIHEDRKSVYLMLDVMSGYIIPYRCLPDSMKPSEFLRRLREYKRAYS